MKIIYNKVLPLGNYKLMNILGLVFSKAPIGKITLSEKRHEQYHTIQQYELLMTGLTIGLILSNINDSWWYILCTILFPFAMYVLGWIAEIALPPYHNAKSIRKLFSDAYRDNCFEREAYANEDNPDYFVTRPIYGMFRYILKKKDRKG